VRRTLRRFCFFLMHAMGIDRSLSDAFPSVKIDGERYHYGQDPVTGQYLVEHHEYAKWYWCFDTRDEMFECLMERADGY
jgi:hypothetical protein